ncbi:sensor histidine kinase [Paenibacillus sp. TAB 01]|uniref:sensor histidine kinase n=1 Tax=Paenibacillus sp. TAB 01 TaxID=3368988 RepID=UPI0037518A9B
MLKTYWFNASLQKKLVMTYLCLVIVPIIIFSCVVYRAYSNSIQSSVNEYANETLRQITLNMDTHLNTLAQLTLTPYFLEPYSREDALSIWGKVAQNLREQSDLDKWTSDFAFNSIMKGHPEVVGVYFFGARGQIYGHLNFGYVPEGYDIKQAPWYDYVNNASGKPVFLNVGMPSFVVDGYEPMFATARQMYDAQRRLLGTFVIFTNMSRLNDIAENAQLKHFDKLYIFDLQNRLIVGKTGNPEENRIIAELSQKGKEAAGQVVTLNKQTYRVTYGYSEFSQLHSLYLVPSITLFKQQRFVFYLILGFVIFSTMISFLIFVWIARRITSPLKQLQLLMIDVEKGNFDVVYSVRTEDEIGRLGASFNNMISQMRRLVYEVYEAELRKKQADFTSLQHQIRPHFLYNVLETINMMAEIKGVHEIGDMISSVGELLRLSLHRNDYGTVGDEIRYVQSYLSIQQIFHKNSLQVSIKVPDEVLELRCNKFILQPIVENAILHGLDCELGKQTIRIDGALEEGRFRLYVTDDGRGISESRMRVILEHLSVEHPESIGLRNVLDRIHLYHGGRYGLRICSMEGEGTTVQITLPVLPA